MDTEPGSNEAVSRFHRLEKDELAPTLRAGTGPVQGSFMAPRPIHPVEARCITVREAARLHSFPDWFCFHSTKWHAFRQIGNAVPPFLGRAVARSIRQVIVAEDEGRHA
jgi:DNA (cytosine-5)-methyltransferase 1